jgi:hypothetical protein
MLFPSHYSVPARARPPRSRSAAAGGRNGNKRLLFRPATAGQGVPGRHRPDIKKRRALPDPPFQPTAPPCCHPPIEGNAAAPSKRDGPTHLPTRKTAPPLRAQKSGGRILPRRLRRPSPLPPPAYRPAPPPKTKGSTCRRGKPLRSSGYKKAADPFGVRRPVHMHLPASRRKPSATARLRGLPPECGRSTRR